LLAPSYEQPEKADCQMWCDPRYGSGDAFRMALWRSQKFSRPFFHRLPAVAGLRRVVTPYTAAGVRLSRL
jgi:hypothetical protein